MESTCGGSGGGHLDLLHLHAKRIRKLGLRQLDDRAGAALPLQGATHTSTPSVHTESIALFAAVETHIKAPSVCTAQYCQRWSFLFRNHQLPLAHHHAQSKRQARSGKTPVAGTAWRGRRGALAHRA